MGFVKDFLIRSAHLTTYSTRSTRLSTRNTRLSTRSSGLPARCARLSFCRSIRCIHLSTCKIFMVGLL